MSDEHIFRRPGTEAQVDQDLAPTNSVGFTIGGAIVAIDAPACFAKQVTDTATGNVKYFVKTGNVGAEAGRLFNPASLNLRAGDEGRKRDGQGRYVFRKVNKEVYEQYLLFLRTRNQQFLRRAERLRD